MDLEFVEKEMKNTQNPCPISLPFLLDTIFLMLQYKEAFEYIDCVYTSKHNHSTSTNHTERAYILLFVLDC